MKIERQRRWEEERREVKVKGGGKTRRERWVKEGWTRKTRTG